MKKLEDSFKRDCYNPSMFNPGKKVTIYLQLQPGSRIRVREGIIIDPNSHIVVDGFGGTNKSEALPALLLRTTSARNIPRHPDGTSVPYTQEFLYKEIVRVDF